MVLFSSSSSSLYLSSDENSGSFDCYLNINPFEELNSLPVQSSPSICLCCGAYLSTTHSSLGKPSCSFCNISNEMESNVSKNEDVQCTDYVEFLHEARGFNRSNLEVMLFLVIDESFCADQNFLFLLKECLISSGSRRLCISLLSICLRFLRLSDFVDLSTMLSADCYNLSSTSCSLTLFEKECMKGIYFCHADDLLKNFDMFVKSLLSFSTACSHAFNVDSALSYVKKVSSLFPSIISGVHCVFLSAKIPLIKDTPLHLVSNGIPKESTLSNYIKIGKQCLDDRVWLDVFALSFRVPCILELYDALVSSTGGRVYQYQDFLNPALISNVTACISEGFNGRQWGSFWLNSSFVFPCLEEDIATLDIRTTSHVPVDSIIGNLVYDEKDDVEENDIRNCVEKAHLEYSLQSDSDYLAQTVDQRAKNLEKSFAKLCTISQKENSRARISRRSSSFVVSIRLSNKCLVARKSLNSDHAFVQLVVRYSAYLSSNQIPKVEALPSFQGSFSLYRITRIINVRLRIVDNFALFLESFQADLWSIGFSKSIVGSFHEESYSQELTEEEEDRISRKNAESPRSLLLKELDQFCSRLVSQWSKYATLFSLSLNHGNVLYRMIQYLYFLREGPLLNGISVSIHESYALRSLFLSSNSRLASLLLIPSIKLIQFQPAVLPEKIMEQSSEYVDPFSLSLRPDCFAIIDCGDKVILRPGLWMEVLPETIDDQRDQQQSSKNSQPKETSSFELEKLPSVKILSNTYASFLDKEVWEISIDKNRDIVPHIYPLKSWKDSYSRHAYTRLSPLHNDPHEIQILYAPYLLELSTHVEMYDALISSLPPTDLPSFHEYLSRVGPNLITSMKRSLADIPVQGVTPIPAMIRSSSSSDKLGSSSSRSLNPYSSSGSSLSSSSSSTTLSSSVSQVKAPLVQSWMSWIGMSNSFVPTSEDLRPNTSDML